MAAIFRIGGNSDVKRSLTAAWTMMAAAPVLAHHSPNLHFIRGEIVEIDGILTAAEWQNPHTQLAVTVTDANGADEVWLIEGRSASQYVRAGVTQDAFQVGDPIRIAGFPGRRNPTALFATNILLASGNELVTDNFVEPRWPGGRAMLLSSANASVELEELPSDDNGIFRVWGPDRTNHGIEGTGRTLWLESYPLTDYARSIQDSWDRIEDNPYIRCGNGMPAIMDLGTPMEFVQEEDAIVLYLEEQDSIRRIYMTDAAAAAATGGPFGISSGHWDGDTLEVTTTDIEWEWFDQQGIPQSDALVVRERFTPSADGRVLRYEMTATDPEVFTEPVILDRVWVWDPTEEVRPYDCVWDRDDL
jgi:hypothetical protein